MEQIHSLTKEIEKLKKDYATLHDKYDYERHELQTIIEQLREDIVDLDKTKQLYIGRKIISCETRTKRRVTVDKGRNFDFFLLTDLL